MNNLVVTASSREASTANTNVFDRWARRTLQSQISNVRSGQVRIDDEDGTVEAGAATGLHASVRVHKKSFYRDVVLGGTLAVGESFVRGDWECDRLTDLLRIFARDTSSTDRMDRGSAKMLNLVHRAFHWWRANTRSGSRKNIAAHYDLGNDFYRLWLDDTMAYSCGIFTSPTATLREASVEKFDRICRRLNLQPNDELVEIGTGWGGFAIHAAENYGCRVTTTTISREQFLLAEQRVREAGLSDRITLLQSDYRDLTGKFDKLVSIEMIEAVGHEFLDQYFGQCSKLLHPHGSMMLQAIVMPERGYARYLRTPDFINRYVFPGGCLPSMGAILDSCSRATDLRLIAADDFAGHYAETLRRWRAAFNDRLSDVRRLGYSDEFIRLWTYYLCYCEAAFEERRIGLLQIQLDKPEHHR